MPNQDFEVVKRELVIFYILDTSGSMSNDGKIGVLNRAMEETVSVLSDIASSNADAEMKIAVLEFNSGAKWITRGAEYLKDFIWDPLTAGGLTDLGEALKELNSKLSREEYLKSATGQFLPILIFMSDGYPTDDWERALKNIKESNKWFNKATKIAFALGEEADESVMAKVVGNSEAVVKTNDMELFRKLIRIISVTSSMINSSSRTDTSSVTGGEIIRQGLKETGGNEPYKTEPMTQPDSEGEEEEAEEPDIWNDNIDNDWC